MNRAFWKRSIVWNIFLWAIVSSCGVQSGAGDKVGTFTFYTTQPQNQRVLSEFIHSPDYAQVLAKSGIRKMEVYSMGSSFLISVDVHPQVSFDEFKRNVNKSAPKNEEAGSPLLHMVKQQGYQRTMRVFSMADHGNSHGQQMKSKGDYTRIVMTLEIVNDPQLREEYIDIHRKENFWPQIIENMKTMGIYDMELYLHGYRAFLIMDTQKDFDLAKDGEEWAKLPREQEWQAYAGKFQKVDPASKASEKWVLMDQIK